LVFVIGIGIGVAIDARHWMFKPLVTSDCNTDLDIDPDADRS
jgi:hypothetical protein